MKKLFKELLQELTLVLKGKTLDTLITPLIFILTLNLFDLNTAIITSVVGYPLLFLILVTSYIYGIYRLRKLKGPGIDEFIQKKEPPFRGQTRGF
ncbi:hypothetical protein BN85315740 [Paracholeplasma brassicae]|uniref:Uncharacterized protein n=1 Tax=Acholeplasma brassicae TaxID=61635 RepID=U4KQ82_9MOLU|nr:hypothetical protein [Paracholeplasma brassicae]CCV66595.1 hypothetical protein BN85315740 [Paracholeplasma brassicae]